MENLWCGSSSQWPDKEKATVLIWSTTRLLYTMCRSVLGSLLRNYSMRRSRICSLSNCRASLNELIEGLPGVRISRMESTAAILQTAGCGLILQTGSVNCILHWHQCSQSHYLRMILVRVDHKCSQRQATCGLNLKLRLVTQVDFFLRD